jgi:hypothetical protein
VLFLDEECVELQGFRQNDVSNRTASDRELVEVEWVFV